MGQLADELTLTFGCSVKRTIDKMVADPEIDSDDIGILLDCINDHDYSTRQIERVTNSVGHRITRNAVLRHRAHGDCSKTRYPNA